MSEGNVRLDGEDRGRLTFVLMPFLGGTTREWDGVVAELGGSFGTLCLDLPGFGGAAGERGYTVGEMADAVGGRIAQAGLTRYVLVGHSMSGKLAMVLARRAQEMADGSGPEGLVLVAPSPPEPEPMSDRKRAEMLALLGAVHDDDARRSAQYIKDNVGEDLAEEVTRGAAAEVLRMHRGAWRAWLELGSREDWTERIGVLTLPALVVAGAKDGALGPEAQRETTMRHLGQGSLRVVEDASHLIPMERPKRMAEMLVEFAGELVARSVTVPSEYMQFVEGERLSTKTREVVERRMQGPGAPGDVLDAEEQRTLQAMLGRIVPQVAGDCIDLAGYVLARLAAGRGDGWRYAVLPRDARAYRAGLQRLMKGGFADKDGDAQDAMLRELGAKKGSAEARWFEDVRADAVEAYAAHPATLARWGYSGFGVGGATTRHKGFVSLEANGREAWEPVATKDEVTR